MIPALSAKSADADAASGIHLRLERRHPGSVEARHDRPRLRAVADPEAARAGERISSTCSPGLSHLQADTFGDGTGDHPRASAVWLTGVHAYDRTRPGVEVRLATTADQLAARVIGKDTQVPSIEMNRRFPHAGRLRFRRLLLRQHRFLAQSRPRRILPRIHPRVVFERLFGDGGSAAQRLARAKKTGSILDSVMRRSRAASPARWARATAPSSANIWIRFARSSSAFRTRKRSGSTIDRAARSSDRHSGLLRRAHQADVRSAGAGVPRRLTRVFSMIMARELSGAPIRISACRSSTILISHHRNDPGADRRRKPRSTPITSSCSTTSWRRCRRRRTATARCSITA